MGHLGRVRRAGDDRDRDLGQGRGRDRAAPGVDVPRTAGRGRQGDGGGRESSAGRTARASAGCGGKAGRARAVLRRPPAFETVGRVAVHCGWCRRSCRCGPGTASSTAGSGCDSRALMAPCSRRAPCCRRSCWGRGGARLAGAKTRKIPMQSLQQQRQRLRRQPVPPDRGLRVPVRLRGQRARRAQRQRRVDVPPRRTADRCSARYSIAMPAVQGRARPASVPRPPLSAGHDDPRDDLGDADRLGRRARPAADRALAPRGGASTAHRRSPTDSDADHVLLRMMTCINGQVEMHVECEPKLDYGRAPCAGSTRVGYGRGRDRGGLERPAPDDRPAGRLRARPGPARTTLREGDTAFVALTWTEPRRRRATTTPTGG